MDKQNIIKEIQVSPFVESRIREIETLTNIIKNSKKGGGRNVFQTLPRHMIRRAASEDIRRIPKSLRNNASKNYINQLTSKKNFNSRYSTIIKKQKLYRKISRRPGLLRLHYANRQKGHLWLETHIWHAKRFHMLKKWNWSIPFKPNDKCYRASLRGANQGCIVQDISYYNCIEITGSVLNISEKFKCITSSYTGCSFALHDVTAPKKLMEEKMAFLYHINSYPTRAIGPVHYTIIPKVVEANQTEDIKNKSSSDDEMITVWIWMHPGIYEEVLNVLSELFDVPQIAIAHTAKIVKNESEERILKALRVALNIESNTETMTKLDTKPLDCKDDLLSRKTKAKGKITVSEDCIYTITNCETYTNFEQQKDLGSENQNDNLKSRYDGFVSVRLLKNRMIRFKLMGRMTLKVIMETLKPAHDIIISRLKEYKKNEDSSGNDWWADFYLSSEDRVKALQRQASIWRDLKEIANRKLAEHDGIISGMVVPLVVRDPRLFRAPIKRTMSHYSNTKSNKNSKAKSNSQNCQKKSEQINDIQVSSNGTTDHGNGHNPEINIKLKKLKNNPSIDFLKDLRNHVSAATCHSPFWNKDVRDKVMLNKAPDHVLNKMRARRKLSELNKIPKDIKDTETYVPMLLVHRPSIYCGYEDSKDDRNPTKLSSINVLFN
ncbi:unnamed protein product [Gordionus sp. m RMFG-2023]